ncbi:MAG: cytochrome b/b6 domain-containing protein [Pseudomonadota bacterium]
MIKIWDIWVRLFHWSLVITVGFLLISGETGAGFFDWHRLAGEIALALILFRLAWGIVGSSNASISALIRSPKAALTHLRDLTRRNPHQERGHNAAGGWAVFAMLLLILVQATTGLFISDDEGWVHGALHGIVSTDLSDSLYNLHHQVAGLIKLLVIVHIVMIAVYFVVGRQNLVKPMITGVMKWQSEKAAPEVHFGSFFIGLCLLVAAFIVAALIGGWFF